MQDTIQIQKMVTDSAHRLFRDHCDKSTLDRAEQAEFPAKLCASLAEQGFHRMMERDNELKLADGFAVIKIAGFHALPIPLAEWMLANRWRENSEDSFVSVGEFRETSRIQIPWGHDASACLGVTAEGRLIAVQAGSWIASRKNIAGESRPTADNIETSELTPGESAFELLAMSRCSLAVGAMQRLLELVIEQVTMREQFGRPLSKFQVIQHSVALMAAEVAVSGTAHDSAIAFLGTNRQREEIAVAKARIGEASGIVAEAAHQLFGAMGFTHEHILHHYTRMLWLWREDYGSERYWQEVLGDSVCARGAEQLWPFCATLR